MTEWEVTMSDKDGLVTVVATVQADSTAEACETAWRDWGRSELRIENVQEVAA